MAIKGIYDKGKVILTEEPTLKTKADVIVTFLPDDKEQMDKLKQKKTGERRFGGLKGKANIPDDFNQPLDELKEYMY